MDSCEVIYLFAYAQRTSDQDKLSACSADAESSAQRLPSARDDTKVVSIKAWTAAHRPDHP
jgi:hypothetical protein